MKLKKIILVNLSSLIFVIIILLPFLLKNETLEKAQEAENRKDYTTAIQYYEIELKKNPDNATLWVRVSELENILGNHNNAAEDLKQAIRIEPTNISYYIKLFETYSVEKNFPQAITTLNEAIKLEPNNVDLYIKLSELYATENNPEKGLATLNQALDLEPNNIDLLERAAIFASWLEDVPLAKKIYRRVIEIEPNNEIAIKALERFENEPLEEKIYENLPKAGRDAEAHDYWQQAIYIYTKYILENPDNPYNVYIWLRIYNIQNYLKEYTEGLYAIQQALELQPNNVDLYEKEAASYGMLEDWKNALSSIEKGLSLSPDNEKLLLKKEEIIKLIAANQLKNNAALTNIPAEGLRLEGEKKWREAINVYLKEIAKNPASGKNYDIWLRISEIDNYLKNYEDSAKALIAAIRLKPKEMSTYKKLIDVYTVSKQPKQALAVVERALSIFTENFELLKIRAALANELNNLNLVIDSFCRILKKDPCNKDALLGLVRVKVKQNYLDAAIKGYQYIFRLYPNSEEWLEYAKIESWRSNFSDAFLGLENYRLYFGCTKAYYETMARILASANYPKMSLSIVQYLSKIEPKDYDFLYTRTLALDYNNQPCLAVASLKEMESLYPDNKDNKDLRDFVITPLRSSLSLDVFRSHDSTAIDIQNKKLLGRFFLNPESSVFFNTMHQRLHEPKMNNLRTLDNHPNIWDFTQRIGLTHQFSPEIRVEAQGGTVKIQERDTYLIYNIAANFRPTDRMVMNFQIGKDLFAVSPKAVSYAIRQEYKKADFLWQPVTRFYLFGQGELDRYSDGNHSGYSRIAPSVGIIRRQYINVDMGGSFDWLHYSWAPTPYHGYWTPHLHRTYQMTTQAYYAPDTNIGYYASIAYGVHKDETMAKYAFAGDLSLQAVYGIYSDWQLLLSAAASIRINSTIFNQPQSNYRIYSFNMVLTKRF